MYPKVQTKIIYVIISPAQSGQADSWLVDLNKARSFEGRTWAHPRTAASYRAYGKGWVQGLIKAHIDGFLTRANVES